MCLSLWEKTQWFAGRSFSIGFCRVVRFIRPNVTFFLRSHLRSKLMLSQLRPIVDDASTFCLRKTYFSVFLVDL